MAFIIPGLPIGPHPKDTMTAHSPDSMRLPPAPLTVKIAVLIVVVLIVGFGISTILTIQREADVLVEQSKVAARRLTAALTANIEAAMLQERPDIARMQIMEMLWQGIKAVASKPVEAMRSVVQRMRNFLPFSPAKEGPFRDLHRVRIIETIAQTVRPAPISEGSSITSSRSWNDAPELTSAASSRRSRRSVTWGKARCSASRTSAW